LGLKGWQWLFIIEGVPAVILGAIVLVFLDDRPEEARWLKPEERQALATTLEAEAKTTRETGYASLAQALMRPRVLVLGLLYFCIVTGLYGIGFWMPQVLATFGLAPLAIGFLTAIPYFVAACGMVLWGARSDRSGERILHIALPLALGGAAFAWSAFTGPLWLAMLALTFATLGIYAAVGTFWSLPTAILTGTGAAAGLALINSMGNLAGLSSPTIMGAIKEATGSFTAGLLFLAGAMLLGAVIVLLFGVAEKARTATPVMTREGG